MAKKSKKAAARYSELSRTKKRKKQPDSSPGPSQAAFVAAPREPSRTQPAPRPAQRPQAESKRGVPSYEHVRGDLRKIGLLAAGMILVLIIVSFVLG